MSGPLVGMRVVELAGIGPGPFAAMLLADMGAEVIHVDRPGGNTLSGPTDIPNRSRRAIAVDLRKPRGAEVVRRLAARADALIDPYRPGVAERLRVGPADCRERNPRLVYVRITGYGQDGPLAPRAGHDIDYLALSGLLHAIGREEEPPPPPLNLLADFGAGGMLCAFAVVAGVFEARQSGVGQVVDVAMVDALALLGAFTYGLLADGRWTDRRADNLFDGANPIYATYETADGKYVAVGAVEEKFQAELFAKLGYDGKPWPGRHQHARWAERKAELAAIFRTRTRDEWMEIFEGSDACVAPVLTLTEAPEHPHHRARATFVHDGGLTQPGVAPRFSRTPGRIASPPPRPGEHTDAVLHDWGFGADEIADLRDSGAIV